MALKELSYEEQGYRLLEQERKEQAIKWIKNVIAYEDLSCGGLKTLNDVIDNLK